ncbi:Pyrroline-5-carboxylate reductase [Vitis vinifera]|uniref:Pyrroline-5-carboxylate reductase n=1 Tax=Vitis vinifera TaxID=29760 RepID=A0A438I6B6_VITVI|nr:Pyrroline-5-carboxylate reductase [Vitis vinifera]
MCPMQLRALEEAGPYSSKMLPSIPGVYFPNFPPLQTLNWSKLADELVAAAARGMAGVAPIPMDTFKLGFIGAGKMAESIAKGVVHSGLMPASRISTAPRSSSRQDAFESLGVKIFETNQRVVEDSDVVVFSVKPQVVEDVVLELRPLLTKKKLLVSVVAGVKLKHLQLGIAWLPRDHFGTMARAFFKPERQGLAIEVEIVAPLERSLQEWAGHSRFIRVMPNTPAAVGKAASVMSLGKSATEEDGGLIANLFGAIGKIWRADEKYFDAVTGLSGSGPAYIYIAIEALADGGVAAGLPRELAWNLASQTLLQGLKINLDKNELISVGEVPNVEELSSWLGCKVGKLPTTYLGLPLGALFKSPFMWEVVEERFHKRLAFWKRQYLSKDGGFSVLKRKNQEDGALLQGGRVMVLACGRQVVWNSGFMRQCQDWELHNFGELLRKLQVLGECSEDEDKLIWKVIKSGNFSVKSFYSFLESDGRVSFPSKVLGAADMAISTGKHPGQLKDDVASPGGTTIAGIYELEKGGFRGILMNAVVAAAKRSLDLSES